VSPLGAARRIRSSPYETPCWRILGVAAPPPRCEPAAHDGIGTTALRVEASRLRRRDDRRRARLHTPPCAGRSWRARLKGGAFQLQLEVLVLAVLVNDRLDQVANRIHGRTLPDANGRRVVGRRGANREADSMWQPRFKSLLLGLLERLGVGDRWITPTCIRSDSPGFSQPQLQAADRFAQSMMESADFGTEGPCTQPS
jgi:hypothetical protein